MNVFNLPFNHWKSALSACYSSCRVYSLILVAPIVIERKKENINHFALPCSLYSIISEMCVYKY